MTTVNSADFCNMVTLLEYSELIGAFQALTDADAPMLCLDVVLERMIAAFGLTEAEAMVDSIAFDS